MTDVKPDDVHEFWFSHSANWWNKSEAFDDEIRRRFDGVRAALLRGEHEDWKATPRGALAYVLVLDQFGRNMYRKDARCFEGDPRALAAARAIVDRGDDWHYSKDERFFLYLPFEHSEVMADQERAVELFHTLGDETGLQYAEAHRDVVRRFGRFPHRNELLGRASTAEEVEFLKQPGSSFA